MYVVGDILQQLIAFKICISRQTIMNNCVFSSSKYYRQAQADPLTISQPIGFQHLHIDQPQQQKRLQRKIGESVVKYIIDKNFVRIVTKYNKKVYQPQNFLQIGDIQRKSYALQGHGTELINKQLKPEFARKIQNSFMNQYRRQHHLLQLVALLSSVSHQHMLHIDDFALSKFYFLLQGSCSDEFTYLYQLFDKQFLQYEVFGVFSSDQQIVGNIQAEKRMKLQYPKLSDINNVIYVENRIRQLKQIGQKGDPMFSGFHYIFFMDHHNKYMMDKILDEQLQFLPWLQYYITILTGILAEGQNAIIPIRGTYRHKTIEYLYLLKTMFRGKYFFIKPVFSNYFTNQKYILLEDYKKDIGDQVHRHLLKNYQLLKEYGENKLLVKKQEVFKQAELQQSVKHFNDAIINKNYKTLLKQFKQYSSIRYYPHKEKVREMIKQNIKVSGFSSKLDKYIDDIIPNENFRDIKQLHKQQKAKKQQAPSNAPSFNIMALLTTSKPKEPTNQPRQLSPKTEKQRKKVESIERMDSEHKHNKHKSKKHKKDKHQH